MGRREVTWTGRVEGSDFGYLFLAVIAVAARGQSKLMFRSFFFGGGRAFFVFLVFFLLTV